MQAFMFYIFSTISILSVNPLYVKLKLSAKNIKVLLTLFSSQQAVGLATSVLSRHLTILILKVDSHRPFLIEPQCCKDLWGSVGGHLRISEAAQRLGGNYLFWVL